MEVLAVLLCMDRPFHLIIWQDFLNYIHNVQLNASSLAHARHIGTGTIQVSSGAFVLFIHPIHAGLVTPTLDSTTNDALAPDGGGQRTHNRDGWIT